MNYVKIYDALIQRARDRCITGYIERHHVIPKCLGGSNGKENIVDLYPEEHYLAHLLLCKIYPGNKKLLFAAMFMTTGQKVNAGHRNNKAYGWLRRAYSLSMSGDNNPNRLYPEIAKAAGQKRIGQKRTDETKQRMSESQRGRTFSDETKAKMSEAAKRRPPVNNETRAKLRASSTGRIGPWRGKTIPDAVRAKMSASQQKIQQRDWNSPNANHNAWSKAHLIFEAKMLSAPKIAAYAGLNDVDLSTIKRIKAKIGNGWNPLTDENWIKFKNEYI